MNGSEIFVGVYGSLRLHPWVTTEVGTEAFEIDGVTHEGTYRAFRVGSTPGPLAYDLNSADAFGAFLSCAEALMWLPDEAPAGGLWGLNDANVVWSPGDSSGLIAWFHVGPNTSLNPPRLPIQPLVAAAGQTLRRFGELTVTGTQLLLPTQLAYGKKQLNLIPSPLILCDPDASVPLRVTLDAGSDEDTHRKAAELAALLHGIDRQPFTFGSFTTDPSRVANLKPDVVDDGRLGPTRHPLTFEATAPEWNLDTAAWVTEVCAEACRQADITTSILVSVGLA